MRAEGQPLGSAEGGELVEREHALGVLHAALDDGLAGRGQVVFVSGEAGVGKSALLRRFAGEAGDSTRVLWGDCDPLFTPRPLGPFVDIAEQAGGEFAELVGSGVKPHQVLHPFLAEFSAGKPAAVFVEDLHWADEASLDLLGLVGRRIGQVAGLVAASFRDDELDPAHPLRTLLGRLATVPWVTRLRLEPLSRAAVAAMAQPHGVDERALYERTGGNPFFVTEVLSGGGQGVPPTVRDAVLARAARAGPGGSRLLESVAIMPAAVELPLLEMLAEDGLQHLDRCLAVGVLVEERRRIRFRHEMARLVIEHAILPARRVTLHRAAFRALRAAPGLVTDPAMLAHHAELANDAPAVLALASEAGDRAAAAGAHREAAGQYARALRFADSMPPGDVARLHERLSYASYLSDQPERAIQARGQALASYRALGDPRGEGESLCWLARLLFFASRDAEAEDAGQSAIRILERLPPGRELAMAYSTVSHMRLLAGDHEAAITWGRRAVALAERCGETEVLVHALNNVGSAEFSTGIDVGIQKLERSLALAGDAGLTEHVVRAYVNLASTAVDVRRYDVADGYLTEGLAYAAGQGIEAWRWYLLATWARARFEQGHWAEAVKAAKTVLEVARNDSFARLTALLVVARVQARRGEPGYRPLVDEATRISELNGHLQHAGLVAAARAEISWLNGDRAAMDRHTRDCMQLAARHSERWIYGELACWRRRAGVGALDPDQGEQSQGDQRQGEQRQADGSLMAEPFALEIAGESAAAADRWLAIGCPYEEALARAAASDEQSVRRALSALTGLGARAAAAVVGRRLRTLGVRGLPRGPRAATARNPAGLTVRELEVLALVANDLPNADIAARLMVSPRTVEHHVSAILRKLSVGSRKEIRSAAARHGLDCLT